MIGWLPLLWFVAAVALAPWVVRRIAVEFPQCRRGALLSSCKTGHPAECRLPEVTQSYVAAGIVVAMLLWPLFLVWSWIAISVRSKPLPLTPDQRDAVIKVLEREYEEAERKERERVRREERKERERARHSVRNGGVREVVTRLMGGDGHQIDLYDDGSVEER